ncbi:MAG: hypothetical protein Q8O83_05320 [bacterium]|nr:hypothetical protein [bacterium]
MKQTIQKKQNDNALRPFRDALFAHAHYEKITGVKREGCSILQLIFYHYNNLKN